jgi:hypothetical protein
MNFAVTSFSWPLCSGDDFSIDETNVDNCLNSPPINGTGVFFKGKELKLTNRTTHEEKSSFGFF